MQYRICPECGAHLDPAEVCDCGVTIAQGGGADIAHGGVTIAHGGEHCKVGADTMVGVPTGDGMNIQNAM